MCIDKLILNKNNCPKCGNEPFVKQKIGRKFKTFLNWFKLNCPFHCGQTIGLIDFENHKNCCENLNDIYRCSLCNKKLEYHQDLELLHKNQCEKLKKSCAHCKKNLSAFEYEEHLKKCNEWMDYCQNCNLMVCKKFQEAHNQLFCPHIQKLTLSIKKLGKL